MGSPRASRLRTKRETWFRRAMSLALIRSSPAVDLNPEQQLAVEHGIGDPEGSRPLLVIAGAGSGKTAMLAHRVAALILAGADPKRIMLATFSRRAAAELGRRVERLLARRLAPEAAAAATPASWRAQFMRSAESSRSWMVNCESSPRRVAYSRRRRAPRPWNVPA